MADIFIQTLLLKQGFSLFLFLHYPMSESILVLENLVDDHEERRLEVTDTSQFRKGLISKMTKSFEFVRSTKTAVYTRRLSEGTEFLSVADEGIDSRPPVLCDFIFRRQPRQSYLNRLYCIVIVDKDSSRQEPVYVGKRLYGRFSMFNHTQVTRGLHAPH